MNKPYNRTPSGTTDIEILRNRLIGLGEVSIQKSYYPELQKRIHELERFKALLNQSNDIIISIKVPEMKVIDINEFACKFLGYTREELVRLPFSDYVGKSVYKWLLEVQDKLIEKKSLSIDEQSNTLITDIKDKNNKLYPIEIKLQLVKWENAYYVIAVARDISSYVKAEKKIKDMNRDLEKRVAQRTNQLKAANTELEAFSYSVSHDLRAPLRTINGFSQVLIDDYSESLDNAGRDYLHRIINASQRMGELIDSLLFLSRSTRVEMKYSDVNLSELVFDSYNKFKDLYSKDKQTIITIESNIIVTGDNHLLQIAIDNIIENALKYSSKQENPKVTFTMEVTENGPVFRIEDNGVGFDMKYSDKLFTPFQRLHKVEDFSGTGIGLATVRRIITRHGGKIWATSEKGKGTCFYFTLPKD